MLQQQASLLTRTQTNTANGIAGNNSHYERARLKAYVNKIVSLLTLRENTLKSKNEALAGCHSHAQSELGIRNVPIADIVGSINRVQDFDRSFMPAQGHTRERWMSVDRAYHRGIPLPPIELYQIDDAYFVVDGHHRISVARSHGQLYIEAHVIRLNCARCRSCDAIAD